MISAIIKKNADLLTSWGFFFKFIEWLRPIFKLFNSIVSHKTGRSGGYTRRLCCHSAWPRQAGKLGKEEPDEVQQGQMQGPAPGEEQPHAAVQAWGGPAGMQLCGEGPGSAGGRQVDHEPAVCPGCQEGQWDPGVHQEECGQ